MSGGISNLVTYNVNSIYRINPTVDDTDHFTYKFGIPIDIFENITHVSITNIQLPRSWYIIQDFPLNSFSLYENGIQIPLTIPIGNYTNIQLFQTLQNVLNTGSLNTVMYTVTEQNSPTLGVDPVPDLNAIQIQSSNPAILSQLFFSPLTILDPILGFQEGFNNFDLAGLLLGGMYNLSAESDIFLTSNCVRSEVNDNIISNQTLCTISVGNIPPLCNIIQKYDIIANMKPFNKINQVFTFEFANEQGIPSFFLNFINVAFTINFFRYTQNKKPYEEMVTLLSQIAMHR